MPILAALFLIQGEALSKPPSAAAKTAHYLDGDLKPPLAEVRRQINKRIAAVSSI
jgi:hypothetical protein